MNAYEIARAEATRVVEAAYRKAVAAGELPEGTIPPVAVETPKDSSNGDWASTFARLSAVYSPWVRITAVPRAKSRKRSW